MCVVVVMVVATVVMVDGLNVLLMFLNILGLMFRPENLLLELRGKLFMYGVFVVDCDWD